MSLDKMRSEHNRGQDQGDDPDQVEEKGPVMYTCLHKNDATHCALWDRHERDPYYYPKVDAQTPCHYCGHRGTLRAVH